MPSSPLTTDRRPPATSSFRGLLPYLLGAITIHGVGLGVVLLATGRPLSGSPPEPIEFVLVEPAQPPLEAARRSNAEGGTRESPSPSVHAASRQHWRHPSANQHPVAVFGEPSTNPSPVASLTGPPKEVLEPPQRAIAPPDSAIAKRDEIWGDYMAQLNRQIDRQWQQLAVEQSYVTKVRFTLNPQGQLIDLRITQSSGSTAADQAALEAIRRAAPFSPLPPQGQQKRLIVHFTFTYNAS